jgi:hypothetical protein
MIGVALASTALWTSMIGFSDIAKAGNLDVLTIQRNWVIPEFEHHNFNVFWQGPPSVVYNTETGDYRIVARPWGQVSPGGTWHASYVLRERTSGNVILSGRENDSPYSVTTTFRDVGDIGYTFEITSVDHLWYTPVVSTININTMRPTHQRVTAYIHFNGEGQHLENVGIANRANLGSWNDQISSLRIQSGMKVTFYEDNNFQNGSRTIMNNTNSLQLINMSSFGNWNDRISSLSVAPITGNEFGANLFQNSNQTGRVIRHTDSADNANLATNNNLNDQISAIELYPNTRIILFEHTNYNGESILYENRTNGMMNVSLSNTDWNDRISSYRVTRLN